MNPKSRQRCQAPKNRAGNNHRLTPVAITQPTGERRGDHIEDEERRSQRTHLLVAGMEFVLDRQHFTSEDVPVNVIQQIEREQQHNCAQGQRASTVVPIPPRG